MKYYFLSLLLILPLFSGTLLAEPSSRQLLNNARSQIGVTTGYDPAYRRIPYPGGDVPATTGVCTDVVIRAYRALGIDLQQLVHEDMKRNFGSYPKRWGLKRPDSNIDHRRVPNLMKFFLRAGSSRTTSGKASNYLAGDIVAWDLGGGVTHIGIISEKKTFMGTPLVIHNIGQGTREEDILFQYQIIGHYRYRLSPQ